jgi:ABC-type transporter Mla maintaining outer membrane lipid asymmetry ATPase subunit MlaF
MQSSISFRRSSEPVADRGAALLVENLTGPRGAVVIHDVCLEVPHGDTRVILGPIQAGKSMLMRHIVGLEQPSEGRIFIDGERIDGATESDVALRRLRARLGVVFEGSALLTRISAMENVELPLLEHTSVSPAEARDAARELLAEVGLSVAEDVTPEGLGRSAQRRVALARALALRPSILLLDEPTQGLDAHAAHEFDMLLAELQARHGFGTLIFTHEVRHAFGIARQIYVMAGGRVVADGDRDALQDSDNETVRQLLHRRGDG